MEHPHPALTLPSMGMWYLSTCSSSAAYRGRKEGGRGGREEKEGGREGGRKRREGGRGGREEEEGGGRGGRRKRREEEEEGGGRGGRRKRREEGGRGGRKMREEGGRREEGKESSIPSYMQETAKPHPLPKAAAHIIPSPSHVLLLTGTQFLCTPSPSSLAPSNYNSKKP